MSKVNLKVSGMTCDHCRGRVDAAVKAVSGVYGVYVDLDEGIAEIDFDESKTSPETLIEAVKAAGYAAEASS